MNRRTRIAAATLTVAAGLIGLGAAQASAVSIDLVTGNNSPKGPHVVSMPDAATDGGINAFTQVVTKGPGDLSNIDITFSP